MMALYYVRQKWWKWRATLLRSSTPSPSCLMTSPRPGSLPRSVSLSDSCSSPNVGPYFVSYYVTVPTYLRPAACQDLDIAEVNVFDEAGLIVWFEKYIISVYLYWWYSWPVFVSDSHGRCWEQFPTLWVRSSENVFQIHKIFIYGSGSSDPYPDFTDSDPTHLRAIVNRTIFQDAPLLIKTSHEGK